MKGGSFVAKAIEATFYTIILNCTCKKIKGKKNTQSDKIILIFAEKYVIHKQNTNSHL